MSDQNKDTILPTSEGSNQEGESAGVEGLPTADDDAALADIMRSLEMDALPASAPAIPASTQAHQTITASDLLREMEETLNAPTPKPVTSRGKPSKHRPGRLPLFYRSEVDRIRADTRSDTAVAEAEGVSRLTISRIRETGKYKGIPYIARDEVDREAQARGEQTHMVYQYRKRTAMGRPPVSGRLPPNDDERKAIAYDKREASVVAQAYGVSRSFVYKMRNQFGVRWVRVDPLTPFQREKFEALKHTKDVEALSRALNLPALVVQALLDGEFAQPVTNGGNDGADE